MENKGKLIMVPVQRDYQSDNFQRDCTWFNVILFSRALISSIKFLIKSISGSKHNLCLVELQVHISKEKF